MRDSILLVQKEAKASQAELLKAFQVHVKDSSVSRRSPPHRDDNQPREVMNRFGSDRMYNRGSTRASGNCFYCEGEDHISRNCAVKLAHIGKGWLTVEDGVQKLGDGNTLPRGRGSAAARGEEYYSKRPVGQHWQSLEVFYGSEAREESDMDAIWDEMRTLRTQLKQLTGSRQELQSHYQRHSPPLQGYRAPPMASQMYVSQGHQGHVGPPMAQPAYMAQAAAPAAVDDQALSNGLARVILNLLHENKGSLEQFATTRTGKETTSQSGQGFKEPRGGSLERAQSRPSLLRVTNEDQPRLVRIGEPGRRHLSVRQMRRSWTRNHLTNGCGGQTGRIRKPKSQRRLSCRLKVLNRWIWG